MKCMACLDCIYRVFNLLLIDSTKTSDRASQLNFKDTQSVGSLNYVAHYTPFIYHKVRATGPPKRGEWRDNREERCHIA